MNFQKADKAFSSWAKNSKLTVQTAYKGEEVRSTDILDSNNKKWQLWLEPVDLDGQCVIHYWNYKDICRHSKVPYSKLQQELVMIEERIITESIRPRYPP